MESSNILKQFQDFTEELINQGYDINTVDNFFSNNNSNFTQNYDDREKHLYFICNNKEVYAALLVWKNSYCWSLYLNHEFQPFQGIMLDDTSIKVEHTDFIVEMIINISKSEKIKKVVPDIDKMDIADRIKILKKIGLNSKGYHIY